MKNNYPKAVTLGLMALAVLTLTHCSKPESDKTSSDKSEVAFNHCKNFMQDRLTSTASTLFPAELNYPGNILPDNKYIIDSYYDIYKDGAAARKHYSCLVKWNGLDEYSIHNWTLISLNQDD